MLRKTIAITTLVMLPRFCSASTYDCVVKHHGVKAGELNIWSGKISLKDDAQADAEVFVIKKDGAGVSIKEITKGDIDANALPAAMKPCDGLLVIGLRKQARNLDLNLGHVDAANKKNSAPMDVDAWSSVETKEIGVTDARKHLTALCQLE